MPWRGARFGLEAMASCSKTNVYEKSIRYEDAAVGRCDPAHSGPDPGADPQVVGRRELRVRARALARIKVSPVSNPSKMVDPHLRRWMLFVDGENFTVRGQRLSESEGLALLEGRLYSRNIFLWVPEKVLPSM